MFPQTFGRTFELWRYSVGHGQLLLRSTKSESCATRVDIGFKNVVYVQLLALMDALTIRVGSESELPADVRRALDMKGKTVFVLETAGIKGFVVAGYGGCREDDGEYNDPSAVLPDLL